MSERKESERANESREGKTKKKKKSRETTLSSFRRRTTRCRCESIVVARVWIQCAGARVRILQEAEYRDDDDDDDDDDKSGTPNMQS